MKQTLLEKAMKSEIKRVPTMDITPEHIELAVAWVNGVISIPQASEAMNMPRTKTSSAAYKLAVFLREGVRLGLVSIESKPTSDGSPQ